MDLLLFKFNIQWILFKFILANSIREIRAQGSTNLQLATRLVNVYGVTVLGLAWVAICAMAWAIYASLTRRQRHPPNNNHTYSSYEIECCGGGTVPVNDMTESRPTTMSQPPNDQLPSKPNPMSGFQSHPLTNDTPPQDDCMCYKGNKDAPKKDGDKPLTRDSNPASETPSGGCCKTRDEIERGSRPAYEYDVVQVDKDRVSMNVVHKQNKSHTSERHNKENSCCSKTNDGSLEVSTISNDKEKQQCFGKKQPEPDTNKEASIEKSSIPTSTIEPQQVPVLYNKPPPPRPPPTPVVTSPPIQSAYIHVRSAEQRPQPSPPPPPMRPMPQQQPPPPLHPNPYSPQSQPQSLAPETADEDTGESSGYCCNYVPRQIDGQIHPMVHGYKVVGHLRVKGDKTKDCISIPEDSYDIVR